MQNLWFSLAQLTVFAVVAASLIGHISCSSSGQRGAGDNGGLALRRSTLQCGSTYPDDHNFCDFGPERAFIDKEGEPARSEVSSEMIRRLKQATADEVAARSAGPASKALPRSGGAGRSLTSDIQSNSANITISRGTHEDSCRDLDWVGRGGYMCRDYAENAASWCMASWQPDWADANGTIADEACCACGGGTCQDHASWASTCPSWRESGLCANNSYGPAWDFATNGTFDSHVIDGVTAAEGCCGCGRVWQARLRSLADYLEEYRGEASQRVTRVLLRSSFLLAGEIPSTIEELANLEVLDLGDNSLLRGRIPAAIYELSELRVLNLMGTSLRGPIPAGISQLSKLQVLDLSETGVSGQLPTELWDLQHLEVLDLASTGDCDFYSFYYSFGCYYALTGEIPEAISQLSKLRVLDLSETAAGGPLPSSLCQLSLLEHLMLASAGFSGMLPSSANFSSLITLDLGHQHDGRISGSLPESIGGWTALELLDLSQNRLRGSLPAAIAALKKVTLLDLGDNYLRGSLPDAIVSLTSLITFDVYWNILRGSIPDAIGKLASVKKFSVHQNFLAGSLPHAIGGMKMLVTLQVSLNEIEGALPYSIGEIKSIEYLSLWQNFFSGTLPQSIGMLSKLEYCDVSINYFAGSLPDAMGNFMALRTLWVDFNALRGSIPDSFANLTSLDRLNLPGNSLSGTLPTSLWQLTRLTRLEAWANYISGSIPSAIGKLTTLEYLELCCGNNISGELPPAIFTLAGLKNLRVSGNALLKCSIPASVGNLTQLRVLDLGQTLAEGTLPPEIGSLRSLWQLTVQDTRLQGAIPAALGRSTLLRTLRLSGCKFEGELPPELGLARRLRTFIASYNRFTGPLPQEYASWSHLETFAVGNNRLSGEAVGAIPLASLTNLSLENNSGLSGDLPDLNDATSLIRLAASNCNFSAAPNALPASLRYVDLSGNRLQRLPQGLYELPNLETLFLVGNMISTWPPKGAYDMEHLDADTCGREVLEGRFTWPNLQVLDVSHNPLNVSVYMFLQTLFWSRPLSEVRAQDCGLHGEIPRFVYRQSLGDWSCSGRTPWQSGVPSLVRLDLHDNLITEITAEPPPVLLVARFDNNKLHHLGRPWFNEGVDQETHARRFPLSSLNITGNPLLRFDVRPAFAECGPLTASGMATDPHSFELSDGAMDQLGYECGSPCPAFGMSLDVDAGSPDEGNLCRCKDGYGLLPDQCWDRHWRDASGFFCSYHVEQGSCDSGEAAAAVCCGCGGTGAGGNGKNCSRCPANTYSFSGNDIYRHRSQCVSCPEGATTAHAVDGGGGGSICDCQCPVGTFLERGELCQDAELLRRESPFTGMETCTPCHFLKTTLKSGSLSESDCICDTANIDELVDAGGLCGCGQGFFLNTKIRQCQRCSDEGEKCAWNGNIAASVKPPELEPGYWAATGWHIGLNESSADVNWTFAGHSIYKCFSPDACVDSRGTCARHRGGLACSLCEPGFYGSPDGACIECHGSALAGLAAMVVCIPVVVLLAHLFLSGSGSDKRGLAQALRSFRVSMKQFLTHLQVVTIVGGFTIKWPLDVKFLFDLASRFSFRLMDAFGVACLADQQSASVEISFRLVFPIVFVVVGIFVTPLLTAPVGQLLRLCIPTESHLEQFRSRMSMSVRDAAKSVFWCCALFFATFFQFGLILFTCHTHPNRERTVKAYPHLHCLGSPAGVDDEWVALATPSAIYTAVCLAATLTIYYRAWKRAWWHLEESGLEHRGANAYLFEDFRNSRLHWPMILLARHAVVNLTGAALSSYGPWQLLITAVVNLVIAVLCLMQNPYVDASNTFMETFNAFSLVLVCAFTTGMGFATEPGIQDLKSLATSSTADSAISLRAKMLLIFQLLSMFGPMAVLAYQIIILLPFTQSYLPKRMRPLSAEDEEDIRHFLREAARADEGGGNGDHDLHRIFDKLDGQELLHVSRYLQAVPASVGVLRSRGEKSGTIRDLVKRGRSSRSRKGVADSSTQSSSFTQESSTKPSFTLGQDEVEARTLGNPTSAAVDEKGPPSDGSASEHLSPIIDV